MQAAAWVREQDGSEAFAETLKQVIDHVKQGNRRIR